MAQFLVKLLLDDSVAVQATLLGQIQAQLSSIASNLLSASANPNVVLQAQNVEVRRVA